MHQQRTVTILCLSSFLKGERFLRECRALGCRVLLLTAVKLRDAWPADAYDDVFYLPDLYDRDEMLRGVSWLARTEDVARIVPLDEFDLEMASALREHLRVPGMGETTVRYFRDKLAMRMRAREAGLLVPDFTAVHNDARLAEFLRTVPAPWVLKPRTSASAIGIRKLHDAGAVWQALDELGDRRSFQLLERFVPGDVLHVDALAEEMQVVFVEPSAYVAPPLDVYQGGGLFATRTLGDGATASEVVALHDDVVRAFGMVRGALHSEFIRAHADGRLYFLETAARVGGAHIVDMVEAATDVDLWREWARLEVANARRETYTPPARRHDHAGLLLSLARQEWPDTSAYADAEIVHRIAKRHHAGLVVASPDGARVQALLDDYARRFRDDFVATMPALRDASQATD